MECDPINLLDPIADHDLNVGLVGWWHGLENNSGGLVWYDLLGKNTGVLTGFGTYTSSSGWNVNTVAFDGTDDAANLGLCPDLELTADMAVMLAFRTTESTGYREWVNAAQGGSPFAGWGFGLGPSGSTMGFWPGAPGNDWSYANTAINDGVWHYGGISISGSTATFYLDGRSDGSFTPGAARNPSGQVKSIGANIAFGRYSQVTLASVRVYNRAITSSDVSDLFYQHLQDYPDLLRRDSRRPRTRSNEGGASQLLALRRRTY